jgi:CheY-like chemotaxis protein
MSEPGPVLYVEDDENDVLFFKRALAGIHSRLPLQVITDGQSAWEFLSGQGSTLRPQRPSLILLDLKLPRKTGHEILSSLKQHEELRKVPVIVMSSSRERKDIERAYGLGADFYMVKRVEMRALRDLAAAVQAYWDALVGDPDHIGSDPSLSQLRRLSEPAEPTGIRIS